MHARFFPGARSRDGAAASAPSSSCRSGIRMRAATSGCRELLARLGISALRISLPYHDRRMPPELTRADYIVSSNVARTVQVCRQAVLDVRRALWWLRDQGYDRLGLLGTSLGSCLAMLTASHEPLVRAQALNHVSPFFADVVWRGVSTSHVRAGLDGHIALETLRDSVAADQPVVVSRSRIATARRCWSMRSTTSRFPSISRGTLVDEFRRREIPTEVAVLPVRALQHRRRAVQVSRRLLPCAISHEELVSARTAVVGTARPRRRPTL